MIDTRKFLKAFAGPRETFIGVIDRLRYPMYKRYVGPPRLYEALGRYQFDVLIRWGLRPEHSLLDIGCGSLRAGRFFIHYLNRGNYFGIEPNSHLVKEGVTHNIGDDTITQKCPTFRYDGDFNLSGFGREFDFILAHSIFTHAAQHQIEKCFDSARSVMSPSSLFFANYNRGQCDYLGKEWIYPGHVAFTFESISSWAKKSGLACSELDQEHPTVASWIVAYDPSCHPLMTDSR